jgi:hypothetical protein
MYILTIKKGYETIEFQFESFSEMTDFMETAMHTVKSEATFSVAIREEKAGEE